MSGFFDIFFKRDYRKKIIKSKNGPSERAYDLAAVNLSFSVIKDKDRFYIVEISPSGLKDYLYFVDRSIGKVKRLKIEKLIGYDESFLGGFVVKEGVLKSFDSPKALDHYSLTPDVLIGKELPASEGQCIFRYLKRYHK